MQLQEVLLTTTIAQIRNTKQKNIKAWKFEYFQANEFVIMRPDLY